MTVCFDCLGSCLRAENDPEFMGRLALCEVIDRGGPDQFYSNSLTDSSRASTRAFKRRSMRSGDANLFGWWSMSQALRCEYDELFLQVSPVRGRCRASCRRSKPVDDLLGQFQLVVY
jgi:hypothetical protein